MPTPARGARDRALSALTGEFADISLIGRINSLFGQKRIPVPPEQGIRGQRPRIASRIGGGNHQNGRKTSISLLFCLFSGNTGTSGDADPACTDGFK
jgi:hypothetical protein